MVSNSPLLSPTTPSTLPFPKQTHQTQKIFHKVWTRGEKRRERGEGLLVKIHIPFEWQIGQCPVRLSSTVDPGIQRRFPKLPMQYSNSTNKSRTFKTMPTNSGKSKQARVLLPIDIGPLPKQ
ncbi:hypothetical protein NPIL_525111 [Nephila pilipes]|uniref:Uncharacterized protein n=1 Tax=Nephila pilipes TaxID=299642 RepID=A0A8X6MT08_NEPPI|nr:hypothetical protein NPIL_384241 [Nephila pilipes]GFT26992.1 hypothetical protein NPIL_525111 [Nephila pilipes]